MSELTPVALSDKQITIIANDIFNPMDVKPENIIWAREQLLCGDKTYPQHILISDVVMLFVAAYQKMTPEAKAAFPWVQNIGFIIE